MFQRHFSRVFTQFSQQFSVYTCDISTLFLIICQNFATLCIDLLVSGKQYSIYVSSIVITRLKRFEEFSPTADFLRRCQSNVLLMNIQVSRDSFDRNIFRKKIQIASISQVFCFPFVIIYCFKVCTCRLINELFIEVL